jgi:RNA polymerase sigma-70 factor (ECF subfamily)
MSQPEHALPPRAGQGSRFATTHWSLVLAAGGTGSQEVRPAMTRLLETYWYPLYAFVRRKGRDADEAFDLTQEFLARLLERNVLHAADPEKGRFRTFLLSALERFLVDEWRREGRKKRGGGRTVLSLSFADAEERYRLEPADTLTPERIYERRWAITLLELGLRRLEEECSVAGREELFAAVKPVIAGEDPLRAYAAIASELGMTEGALKTQVHRLRGRFRAILRAEIGQTVAGPADVAEEIQHLFQSLR